jgi:KDO2-lipid IV(A) lauroyltransferase
MSTKVRRDIYYYCFLILSKCILFIPYKFAIGKLSIVLGNLLYYIVSKYRLIAIQNLSKCFPSKSQAEIKIITKGMFRNETKSLFELMNFPRINSEFITQISKIDNIPLIYNSLKKGNGILLASAHTGNWELAAAAIANLFGSINVIAKKIYINKIHRVVLKYRTDKNIKVILRDDKNCVSKILKALRSGEIVAILIDQDTNVSGVFVDFFGYKTWTPAGIAVLALRTGADVLLGYDQLIDKYRHIIKIKGPFDFDSSVPFKQNVINITQKISYMLEQHIVQYPQQWVWFHERWKTKQKS